MSNRDPVQYEGTIVGHLRSEHGVTIFEWSQSPFRCFCNDRVVAYGMSTGLADELQEQGVDNIEVEDYSFGIAKVFQSKLLEPDHTVFNQDPGEAQYLIRVRR